MTKQELREIAEAIRAEVDGKSAHVHVGTWLDRPGFSLEVRYQSASDGRRIAIFKYDDEETCNVRLIFGSFWRPRPNREGVEYARVDDVAFTTEAISDAIRSLVAVEATR